MFKHIGSSNNFLKLDVIFLVFNYGFLTAIQYDKISLSPDNKLLCINFQNDKLSVIGSGNSLIRNLLSDIPIPPKLGSV